MSGEEELRKTIVELKILEGTSESLQGRISLLSATITESKYAKNALEGLEKESRASSLFVPIGGGSYVKARLDDTEKVVYGVGAGIAIEKSLKEAKSEIGKRVSDLEKTRNSFEQQLVQVLRRIQGNRDIIQRLSTDIRRRESTK